MPTVYSSARCTSGIRCPSTGIVDVEARLVEVWRPEDVRPAMISDRLTWQPDAEIAPLVIELGAYFMEVHGG